MNTNTRVHKARGSESELTILDIMAAEVLAMWRGMAKRESHPPPCDCGLCLYNKQKKKRGAPFSRNIFISRYIVHKAKMAGLVKSGRAKKIAFQGKSAFRMQVGDYDKEPYLIGSRAIIQRVCELMSTEEADEFISVLDTIHIYKKRYEKDSFQNGADAFARERRNEWLTTQTWRKKAWDEDLRARQLAQKAARYIESRLGNECSQRELMRRFGKKKVDIERIYCSNSGVDFFSILGVRVKKVGKSTVFYKVKRIVRT